MKYVLMASALISAALLTPALADTTAPSRAEERAAFAANPIAPVSDTELHAYASTKAALAHVYPAPPLSETQSAHVREQTAEILQSHHLTATRYNEITTALDLNPSLAQRYAALTLAYASGE